MRGVTTGGDGQATTSQPSVGMYLDEQPITTIQGNLDIHMYDIARVEALAGPQGTLYGASSQAGTIRIITNKPDPSGFDAGYGSKATSSTGTTPATSPRASSTCRSATTPRSGSWAGREEAGWIDNVAAHAHSTRRDLPTPTDDITSDNAEFAEDNYNTIETTARARHCASTSTRTGRSRRRVMYQTMDQEGSWGDDLNDVRRRPARTTVAHFRDEYTDDEWWQAGLTIEGTIGNFDVVYSGNYLDRDVESRLRLLGLLVLVRQLYSPVRRRLSSRGCSSTTTATT